MFCPNCGKENEGRLDVCPACGTPLRQQSSSTTPVDATVTSSPPCPTPIPAEPPPSHAKGNPTVAGYRVAGLGDRLIAIILDGIMMLAVFAAIGTWVASLLGGRVTWGFSMQDMPAYITIGLTMLFGFIYFWFMESLAGGTLGKRIMGLQVRAMNGARCTLTQSLIRNVLRVIDGLAIYLVGFFIALFSRFRQRLGDHLAKTVVLDMPPGTALRIVFVVLWLAVIACGIWGAVAIHARMPT